MEIFLRLEAVGDNDDGTLRELLPECCRKKRLRRRANFHGGQRSAIFQPPGEGAHSGKLREVSEQVACRLYW